MRKVLVILLLATLGSVDHPLAAQTPSNPSSLTIWQHEVVSPENSPNFSERYSLPHCIILVWRDGSGVTLVVEDPHYTDPQSKKIVTLHETVTIKKVGSQVILTPPSYGETSGLWEHFGLPEHTIPGYDIFLVYYQGKANALPPNIKRLFWGAYGLGTAP